jgi:hypothetical protein
LANTGASLTLVNTILDSGAAEGNVYGALTDAGHNLCSDRSGAFTAAGSVNDVDPRVSWLADNGGLTPTAALEPDSPAIDNGDDASSPPNDQRGQNRVGISDIGAFEFNPLTASPTILFHIDAGNLVLTWPITLDGWRLQSSEDPATGVWWDVEPVPVPEGSQYTYTTSVTANQALYFRLTR